MILSRDFDKGVNDLSIAISSDPTNTELYYWRATAYYNLKKYDDAILDFNKAIELMPNAAGAIHYRGNSYYYKGEYEKAIIDFDKAMVLNPEIEDEEIYILRGYSKYNLNMYDASILDFQN